jgi:hypothetical protein
MKKSSPPMMLKLLMQALNIVLMYLPVQTILQGKNKIHRRRRRCTTIRTKVGGLCVCVVVKGRCKDRRRLRRAAAAAAAARTNKDFNTGFFVFYCSFSTDYQFLVDARVLVTVRRTTAAAGAAGTQELLWPPRHELTLPLHGMNMLFQDVTVAINHHNKQDADR